MLRNYTIVSILATLFSLFLFTDGCANPTTDEEILIEKTELIDASLIETKVVETLPEPDKTTTKDLGPKPEPKPKPDEPKIDPKIWCDAKKIFTCKSPHNDLKGITRLNCYPVDDPKGNWVENSDACGIEYTQDQKNGEYNGAQPCPYIKSEEPWCKTKHPCFNYIEATDQGSQFQDAAKPTNLLYENFFGEVCNVSPQDLTYIWVVRKECLENWRKQHCRKPEPVINEPQKEVITNTEQSEKTNTADAGPND